MKKIIFIIIISIWTLTTFSQDYYPLIEENRTWNVISVGLVGPYPWDTTYSTLTYEFSGDTTFDSNTYLKLYESNEEVPTNWNLWCYMREDNDKRIWYRQESDDEEMLMYDFSVELGDSVFIGIDPVYLFVDSISEIEINQTVRKKYWLSCKMRPDYSETWIEGIGSSKGICWSGSAYIVGGWFWFLCMSENQELIYMNPNYNSCYLISTEIEEVHDYRIQVYPNPTKDKIKIKNNENMKIESISIIDLNGQILLEFRKDKNELDLSGLSLGIYLLKLTYKNGEVIRKIMIE